MARCASGPCLRCCRSLFHLAVNIFISLHASSQHDRKASCYLLISTQATCRCSCWVFNTGCALYSILHASGAGSICNVCQLSHTHKLLEGDVDLHACCTWQGNSSAELDPSRRNALLAEALSPIDERILRVAAEPDQALLVAGDRRGSVLAFHLPPEALLLPSDPGRGALMTLR